MKHSYNAILVIAMVSAQAFCDQEPRENTKREEYTVGLPYHIMHNQNGPCRDSLGNDLWDCCPGKNWKAIMRAKNKRCSQCHEEQRLAQREVLRNQMDAEFEAKRHEEQSNADFEEWRRNKLAQDKCRH